jgi:hypothetical protein
MVKMLMAMHNIVLCTLCIVLYVSVSYLHIYDRPCGVKTRRTDGASLS